jgi:Protein of unknown function (DUF1425)
MKINSWMTMALLAGVVVWAGCKAPQGPHPDPMQPYNPDAQRNTPEGPYVAVAKPNSPEAAGAPVVLLNSDLVQKLAVDHPPMVQRNANNLLVIQVGLRNRTDDERLRIQAQTLFFDESGRVLYSQPDSEAAWQTLILSPNQTTYYTQQALTPEATRYVVRVRFLHKTR